MVKMGCVDSSTFFDATSIEGGQFTPSSDRSWKLAWMVPSSLHLEWPVRFPTKPYAE